ncbi:MAG TPA: GTP-binding protein [Candidatus Kapabacteria bacterium]|nr:GTP-binding protein [Candidatus Kapabacteria bacterium]
MKPEDNAKKPQYIIVNGFLGAGKTTSIASLAARLPHEKIGVITNDEGTTLTDTADFRSRGLLVQEVTGGAFVTQPEALLTAAESLTRAGCTIIFAECAGTSANLHQRFLKPVLDRRGATVSVAPLSVVVDALRAARVLRLLSGGTFSEKLSYLYRKQIEDAQILLLNKCDLVTPAQLNSLRKALGELAPTATLLEISARNGSGLDSWINLLSKPHAPLPAQTIAPTDQALLDEAEALVGWLNCTVTVSTVKYFDASKLLTNIATAIQSLLRQDGIEVAHLKLLLRAPNESTGAIDTAAINLAHGDVAPELTGAIHEPVQRAELTLNLRAEAKPDLLHTAVNNAVMEIMQQAPELFARMEHCEDFRPTRSARTSPALP